MYEVELIKLARNTDKGFNFNKISGVAYLGLPEKGRSFRMEYNKENGKTKYMHTSMIQKVLPQEGNKITFETINGVYELVLL